MTQKQPKSQKDIKTQKQPKSQKDIKTQKQPKSQKDIKTQKQPKSQKDIKTQKQPSMLDLAKETLTKAKENQADKQREIYSAMSKIVVVNH